MLTPQRVSDFRPANEGFVKKRVMKESEQKV